MADSDDGDDNVAARGPALEVQAVDGGVLRVYFNEATEDLYCVATCDCGHGRRCTMRRTLLPSKRQGGPKARGRPIGLLVAWLRAGKHASVTSRRRHKQVKMTRRDRQDARIYFESLPNAYDILEHERPQRPDEETEPWKAP